MFGIVGAGLVSCVSAKPFASKAAPKAYKTGKHWVILLVFTDVLILLWSDVLRQVIASLDTLEHRNEIGVPVIEDFAGKALHFTFHGTTAAK